MTQEENIIVPRWFLEVIEDTLRIQNNINLEKETGETCQDRNVKQSLNGIRKLLKGEELTGMERLEKLQPFSSSNLDEAAEEYAPDFSNDLASKAAVDAVRDAFKAGADWMAEHGGYEAGYMQAVEDVDRMIDEKLKAAGLVITGRKIVR